MPRALTFGERISQLQRAYTAKGHTKREFAESMGVHPSTVRRWKDVDMPAPRSPGDEIGRADPVESKRVAERLRDRFPGLEYSKLRRREKYHFREAPAELRPTGPEVPEDTPEHMLAEATRGLAQRGGFAFTVGRPDASGSILGDNPEFVQAALAGERLTLTYRAVSASDASEVEVEQKVLQLSPTGSKEDRIRELRAWLYRFARQIEGIFDGSYADIQLAAVHSAG